MQLEQEQAMGRRAVGDQKLSKAYSFRLPEDQAAELNAKIAESGLDASVFLRDFVLKNKTTVIAKPKASLEKRRMQFVINKAGNNLNQIAHLLNTANKTQRLTDQLFQQATAGLQEIAKYMKAALDHVD
jgi:hypothetical protein